MGQAMFTVDEFVLQAEHKVSSVAIFT